MSPRLESDLAVLVVLLAFFVIGLVTVHERIVYRALDTGPGWDAGETGGER